MKTRGPLALASILLGCAIAVPAAAGVAPYVRLDYGSNQLRMTDGNRLIHRSEAMFTAAGLPASFLTVGSGYGPGGSAGLWLLPALRVGATYSSFRSLRSNRLHVPGVVFYADDLDFRMTEIGGEAAVRFQKLAGLTVGARVAQGKAEMIEGFSLEDPSGQYYQDATANRTRTTYGAFLGIDQTNASGVAGFVRVGWDYRDMGQMPSRITMSDGTSTSTVSGKTIWLDYSGVYVKAGIGYDLVH